MIDRMVNVDSTCWCVGCNQDTTHHLVMKVTGMAGVPEFEAEYGYCLEHALHFAAWLPYNYPEMYTLVEITPPAKEFLK